MKKRSKLLLYLAVASFSALTGFGAVYVSLALKGNGGVGFRADGGGGGGAGIVLAQRGSYGGSATPATAPAKLTSLKGLNRGAMAAFLVSPAPKPVPAFTFKDVAGKERRIAEWQGKVVLLNVWATWCAPCRREMPTLERLKKAFAGRAFDVLAVSIDKGSIDRPKRFFEEIGIKDLAVYHDGSTRVSSALRVFGMPTTILIDRRGRELGRLVGPAEWDSPEAQRLVEAALGLTS